MRILYSTIICFLLSFSIHAQESPYLDTLDWYPHVNLFVTDSNVIFIEKFDHNYRHDPISKRWHIHQSTKTNRAGLAPSAFSYHSTCIDRFFPPSYTQEVLYELFNIQDKWEWSSYEDIDNVRDWFYFTQIYKKKHHWRFNSDASLDYSNNNGENWIKLNIPQEGFIPTKLTMKDSLTGALGGALDHLYLTTDNWKTYKRIPTPHQQKKYKNTDIKNLALIQEFFFWEDYYIIRQDGKRFYTQKDIINWIPLNLTPIHLLQDPVSQKIFALQSSKDSIHLFEMNTINDFSIVNSIYEKNFVATSTFHNGNLYFATQNLQIYIINKDTVHQLPKMVYFTPDANRPPPPPPPPSLYSWSPLIDKFVYFQSISTHNKTTQLKISRNSRRILYQSNMKETDWHPIALLDYSIVDLYNHNDSLIIFDGTKTYLFDEHQKRPIPFEHTNLLDGFLLDSIKSLKIGFQSLNSCHCYYCTNSCILLYERSLKDSFQLDKSNYWDYDYDCSYSSDYEVEVDSFIDTKLLKAAISPINKTEYRLKTDTLLTVMTPQDKTNYLDFIINHYRPQNKKQCLDKSYLLYDKILQLLEGKSTSIWKNIALSTGKKGYPQYLELILTIEDSQGKKIHIYTPKEYYEPSFFERYHQEGHPWVIHYQGKIAVAYNPAITQFILSLLPKNHCIHQYFPSNQQLLKRLAGYLYRP